MLLYLDNCSMNRPFDVQSQMKIKLETEAKLYIQHKIIENKYKIAWSYMLDIENNENPYDDKRNTIAVWKERAAVFQPAQDEVLILAKKYQGKGLDPKDALHLACAVSLKCDYFITTDKGILRKSINDIKVLNPIDFIRETEE